MAGYLLNIDDLFMLPECLRIAHLADRLRHAIDGSRSLLRALHRAHGLEFYSIGLLRLIADLSGFAGPLLLGGLLTIDTAAVGTTEEDEFDGQPYVYALGLFGSTLLCEIVLFPIQAQLKRILFLPAAFCGTHFNWRMAVITMKMRIGLVTAIYSKSLEARNLSDSRPEILNLMSTDTDRIVNSCISFHSFWSIPFQLVVTLYLLYTQIGAAFIAGVCFAAALIPINRWIAGRIGVYSTQLMSAKDERVSVSSEALTNAKHIKLLAWEDVFIEKILGKISQANCKDKNLKTVIGGARRMSS